MAEPEKSLKRVLQIKMRALGDAAQVLALVRSAAPFYRTLGGTGFRVLQNVDDPAQLLVEIEYGRTPRSNSTARKSPATPWCARSCKAGAPFSPAAPTWTSTRT